MCILMLPDEMVIPHPATYNKNEHLGRGFANTMLENTVGLCIVYFILLT